MEQFTHETYYEFIKPNNGEQGYRLVVNDTMKTRDGVAWVGTIYRDDYLAGTVECDGHGGAYSYFFGESAEKVLFQAAVIHAYLGRDMIDVPADCFINWLDRPEAVAA